MTSFRNKKFLFGISGGIAVYKTCDIIRELKKNGAHCRVVMTEAATKFVAPLTFQTLTEAPVLLHMFDQAWHPDIVHIESARWADAVVICPATANIIGKIANGIADDLLTTLMMATTARRIICPAMNTQMYLNPLVQANIEKLKFNGYQFIEPGSGFLACNEEGIGRLADKSEIMAGLKQILFGTGELQGQKILISAGRTEEPWDPVRMLTNRSSGKMGFALAEAARLKGAEVTLVSGPNDLQVFPGVRLIRIKTAAEMATAILDQWTGHDILIMAAAVADFRPKTVLEQKLKKNQANLVIELERTTDILAQIQRHSPHQIVVGFAVETDDAIENARKKLDRKNLNFIVMNNPRENGAAFETDTNKVTLVDKDGISELPLMSKLAVAECILNKIIEMRGLTPQNRTTSDE